MVTICAFPNALFFLCVFALAGPAVALHPLRLRESLYLSTPKDRARNWLMN
jgi:hypothetical protein